MTDSAAEEVGRVVVSAAELARWENLPRRPMLFNFTAAWARFSPKGRGWVPRRIGRGPLKSARVVIRTSTGNILAVEPRDLDYYTTIVARGGQVDSHVRDACLELIRPGHVFYDIGANAGYIAIEVAAAQRGAVRVAAFEPQPWLARAAAISVHLNRLDSTVSVFEWMLGERDETSELFVPTCGIHASSISREAGAARINCRMRKIDTLVATGQLAAPDVMKVDVEGAELEVFRGAEDTIRRKRPAIVFEADANMQRHGYGRKDLVRYLSSLAPYRFYFAGEHGRVPCGDRLEDPRYSDLVALVDA